MTLTLLIRRCSKPDIDISKVRPIIETQSKRSNWYYQATPALLFSQPADGHPGRTLGKRRSEKISIENDQAPGPLQTHRCLKSDEAPASSITVLRLTKCTDKITQKMSCAHSEQEGLGGNLPAHTLQLRRKRSNQLLSARTAQRAGPVKTGWSCQHRYC